MGNHNSGRRPAPSKLAILRGNPGKRHLNLMEPRPPVGDVRKPEGLPEAVSAIWDAIAPVCLAMGTLTTADVQPFVTLCYLQATFNEAVRQKAAPGFAMFTLSEDYNGAPKVGVHAAIKVERETAHTMRPYYEYFGMTPASRARISVPGQGVVEPESKWAGALK